MRSVTMGRSTSAAVAFERRRRTARGRRVLVRTVERRERRVRRRLRVVCRLALPARERRDDDRGHPACESYGVVLFLVGHGRAPLALAGLALRLFRRLR